MNLRIDTITGILIGGIVLAIGELFRINSLTSIGWLLIGIFIGLTIKLEQENPQNSFTTYVKKKLSKLPFLN